MSRTVDIPFSAPEPVRAGVWRRCRDALARLLSNALEERIAERGMVELQQLDDHILKDIGITRSEIESLVRRRGARRPY